MCRSQLAPCKFFLSTCLFLSLSLSSPCFPPFHFSTGFSQCNLQRTSLWRRCPFQPSKHWSLSWVPRLRFGTTPLLPYLLAFQPNHSSVHFIVEQTLNTWVQSASVRTTTKTMEITQSQENDKVWNGDHRIPNFALFWGEIYFLLCRKLLSGKKH